MPSPGRISCLRRADLCRVRVARLQHLVRSDRQARGQPTPAPGQSPLVLTVPPAVTEKRTADLDEMVKKRVIRAGVVYSRTHYFIDKGVQRGAGYDSLKLFEDEINKKYKTGTLKANVVFVPLSRDQLLPALVDGRVDLVAAMLTVTPERQQLVDFSDPTRTDVNEIVVTGPGAPALDERERPVGARRIRPALELVLPEPDRAERSAEGRREAAGRAQTRARDLRGRRHPRDGECGPREDRRRRRLHGGVLEEGVPEPHAAQRSHAPHRRQHRRGDAEEQPAAHGRRECAGSSATARRRCSATRC